MSGIENLTGMRTLEAKKNMAVYIRNDEQFRKDLTTLISGDGKPGLCKNLSRVVEFSVHLTAERVRNGLDLRPLM